MTKQGMVFDLHNMTFKNFWLEVANKKPLSTKSVLSHKSKNTGKMLLAVNNASKIIWNWFLKLKTWNFQNNLQFANVSKVHRCNMSTGCYIFIYALIYVLIYSCPCLKKKKKKKLRYISCNNLIFEVVNINY